MGSPSHAVLRRVDNMLTVRQRWPALKYLCIHAPCTHAPVGTSTMSSHLISTSIVSRCSTAAASSPSRMGLPAGASARLNRADRKRHCVLRSRSLWGMLADTRWSRSAGAVGTRERTCRKQKEQVRMKK